MPLVAEVTFCIENVETRAFASSIGGECLITQCLQVAVIDCSLSILHHLVDYSDV